MPETQVGSLVWVDSLPCHWAAKPMSNYCGACTLEPGSCNSWVRVPKLLKSVPSGARALQRETPLQWATRAPHLESSPRSPRLERSPGSGQDPARLKKWVNKVKFLKGGGERILFNLHSCPTSVANSQREKWTQKRAAPDTQKLR